MVDSSDMAIQDDREQALLNNHVAVSPVDAEAESSPTNLPVEKGSSTESKENKLKKDLSLALFLLTISTVILMDTLFLRGSASKLPIKLKFAAFFAFTAFVTAICLMFHILKLMTIQPEHLIPINQLKESLGDQYSIIYVKVSVFLMLGGGLAGILALLLCKLLSSSNDDDHRRTWHRAILATANAAMLAMLVPSLIMIAETILHGLLVAAVFPVVAAALAWAFLNFCTAAGAAEEDDGKGEHQGTMYAISVAVASVSFGAILAVFAGLLGGAVGKGQLKVYTFFMTSAFVAATSLGVVTSVAAPTRKASVSFAAAVLACCGLGSLVLAALALFYQIGGVGP
ncbi:hypothetical protein GUJ93_ZPchr0006g45505 [Zizania palustris]|uniref:Uncharacterized protein n=1 Tax=Zizania palustris TaxID=103762 RepID=A0A8J5SSM7_ZIZPA|nr:hypothetical protein GUJ93_ZPchr0006g45505 [Zizania palustris]